MDERQREHLIRQLDHEADLAKRAISGAIQTANRGIAARGLTRSSVHTQAIAKVVHEHVVAFVKTCFESASSIANGLEAHGIAQKFASEFADSWTPKTDDIAWPGVSVLRGQVEMGVRIMHQSTDSLRQEIARIYELEVFRFEDAGSEAQLPENPTPAAKPKRGRPRKTGGYVVADQQVLVEMRALLAAGSANSLTDAARQLAQTASGPSEAAKVDRLRKRYVEWRQSNFAPFRSISLH
jgi:hypothetical protein